MKKIQLSNILRILNWKFPNGFTLVELLVSTAIFLTVGTIVITVLFISFRVNQRTESTLAVKNIGSNALTQIANTIKYASSLDNPVDCTTTVQQSSISVTSSFDGGKTVLSCPTSTVQSISSNSALLINTHVTSVQGCSFTCSQASVYDPPTITIQFNLVPFDYLQAAYPFQTSVTMRNYSR